MKKVWTQEENDRLWWMVIEQGRDIANVARTLDCTQREVRLQVSWLQQNPPGEPINRPSDLKDVWGSDEDDALWALAVTEGASIEDCVVRFERSANFLRHRLRCMQATRSLEKPVLIPDWFTPKMAEVVQSLLQYYPRAAAEYVALQKKWKDHPPSKRASRGQYQLRTG